MTSHINERRGQREALPHLIAAPSATTEAARHPTGLTPAEIRQVVLDILG